MKKPTPFGKYFLLERINVGGMAEVFRAKAFGVEGFERLVAVKRILPNIAEDKEFIRMFIEEAKLSVQLNHANIAQIFDLGVVDNSYYIALEHVHGRDLRGIFDRCRQMGEPMPVAQACFVVMKVCEGLDYAHNKRDQGGREISLVHRDVSPQNVLVSFEGEVKIIDFGIAKAAGKGSKTQAGILKGKFGYMSPEQVRGLPVDRRSDVFSCGIVLYELLTGERLFVGESDFSTLEKVRNVEILPPSTYNRRIPDELERIVLKALSKDVEDRYQNAIDLHDELQAFVYTAGEFYSRKDLAGWMKKTFGKEIEEETAKLESYRQLKPPPSEPPARPSSNSRPPAAPPPRKSTQSMGAVGVVGTKPPPPPTRTSQQLPVVPVTAAMQPVRAGGGDDDLAWDDDELETQIYDNPEDDPRNQSQGGQGGQSQGHGQSRPRVSRQLPTVDPGAAPMAAAPTDPTRASMPSAPHRTLPLPPAVSEAPTVIAPPAATATANGPDLSGLVPSTAHGWQNGAPLNGATNAPNKFPTGSHNVAAAVMEVPSLAASNAAPRVFDARAGAFVAEQPFDPMAHFGRQTDRPKRTGLWIAIAAAAAVAVAIVIVVIATSGSKDEPTSEPNVAISKPTKPVVDGNTGFDLYVSPPGITQWKLDGEARTDRLPSRIRGIPEGEHTVQIEGPPGFISKTEKVKVEAGKAGRVDITLEPNPNLVGVFETTPPGATVTLIVDGQRQKPLGDSPQRAPLDPRKTYQVLFEKQGYVSVNRPIHFSGNTEEKFFEKLEKTGGTTVAGDPTHKPPDNKPPDNKPPDNKPPDTKVVDHKPPDNKPPDNKPPDTKPKGNGTLVLGSKPPCEIFIDGAATGLHTPQSKLPLAAGRHTITLVNNEFGIREKFTVDIKPDEVAKAIKDYSDRLPK